jgi:hypothetical protein
MPSSFNSSIGTELASLRALGAIRRRDSARERLLRERRNATEVCQKPRGEAGTADTWGADD